MTPDLATLRTLLSRVEAAEGGDAELDYDICKALDYTSDRVGPRNYKGGVTSSIDAAVGLVETVMPEANCWGIESTPREIVAHVSRNNVASGHWLFESGRTKTAPLAILSACLRALIAMTEKEVAYWKSNLNRN